MYSSMSTKIAATYKTYCVLRRYRKIVRGVMLLTAQAKKRFQERRFQRQRYLVSRMRANIYCRKQRRLYLSWKMAVTTIKSKLMSVGFFSRPPSLPQLPALHAGTAHACERCTYQGPSCKSNESARDVAALHRQISYQVQSILPQDIRCNYRGQVCSRLYLAKDASEVNAAPCTAKEGKARPARHKGHSTEISLSQHR